MIHLFQHDYDALLADQRRLREMTDVLMTIRREADQIHKILGVEPDPKEGIDATLMRLSSQLTNIAAAYGYRLTIERVQIPGAPLAMGNWMSQPQVWRNQRITSPELTS